MALGQVLRQRRRERKMTQDQVAEQVGISKPYLSNIETGKVKNPPSDRILRAMERALGFQPDELMKLAHMVRTPMDIRQDHEALEKEVQMLRGELKRLATGRKGKAASPPENVRTIATGALVPVINKVSAGYPQHFTDLDYPVSVADEYIRCPDLHDPNAFAARVVGDSMEPDYHEGDIVIFAPGTVAQSGDDCFVRFEGDGGTTFKRAYQDDEQTLRLQPLNSRYPSQTFPRERVTGLWPAAFRVQRVARREN